MLKKSIQLVVLGSSILTAGTAIADTGFYVSGKLGASFVQMKDQNYYDDDFLPVGSGYSEYANWGGQNKTAVNLGIQGGYNFRSSYDVPVRLELDYTARLGAKTSLTTDNYNNLGAVVDSDVNMKTKIKLHSLMINGYYDIDTGTAFTPYVGAGVGVGIIKAKFTVEDPTLDWDGSFSKRKTRFAWALTAGVSYALNDNLDLDFGYRYLDAGKFEYKDSSMGVGTEKVSMKLKTHDVSLGVRYSF